MVLNIIQEHIFIYIIIAHKHRLTTFPSSKCVEGWKFELLIRRLSVWRWVGALQVVFFFFFRIFFCHSLNKSFLHLNHEEIIIKRRNAVDYQQAKWFGVILPLRIRVAPEFPTANVKESILKSCVALEYTKAQNGTDGYLVLLVPHILRTLHKLWPPHRQKGL